MTSRLPDRIAPRVAGRLRRELRRIGGRPLVAWERRTLRPELSVVMPVHNVQAYLRECLDTVLAQSLRGALEVIAVDDGSTDESLAILREYERHDGRVRVLTQPNSGQGIARNVGVEHARGEFLTFVDSDDTVPPGSFAHMVSTLRRSGSDFCVGSVRRLRDGRYTRTSWQRTVHQADRIGTTLEESPAAMQDIICANRMFRAAFWRERVGGFRGHIAYEDHVPMLMAYVRARKFDILSRVTYNWRIREDHTSTGQQKASIQNLHDRIAVKQEAHELLKAEASDFVYDLWVARCLEVDLPPYAARGLEAHDSYRALLEATYRTFRGRATDRAWDLVRVFPKVRAHLVAEGRWNDVDDATDYFLSVQQLPPTRVAGGHLVADLPERAFSRGLPAHLLRLAPLEAHFEGVVQKIEWHEDHVTLTGWVRHRGLDLPEPPELTLAIRSGNRAVALEVRPRHVPEANLWEPLAHAGCAHGGFRVEVPLSLLAAGDTWHLHAELRSQGITSSGAFHYPITGSSADHPRSTHGVEAFWDPSNGFTLRRRITAGSGHSHSSARSRPAVTSVQLVDDELVLQIVGGSPNPVRGAVLMGPMAQLHPVTPLAQSSQPRVRFDMRTSLFRGPRRTAPVGTYELHVDGAPASPAAELFDTLPLRLTGPHLTIQVLVTREHVLQLVFSAPLRDDELGRFHQTRLQAAYQLAREPIRESIVLASDLGRACTDSPLAIDRRLAVSRPDLERIWAVRDLSVGVPEGARTVIMDSAEWYDAVATSRWICSNMNLGRWLRLRPDQGYLQTAGGHPSVAMGEGLWRSKGFPPGRVRHLARSARSEWDLLLMPNREAEKLYREQYGYAGPVLVAGAPRTDVLTAPPSGVRRDVLARLGVPEDQIVVLYAPAERDALTVDRASGELHRGLDLPTLTRRLGDQHTVLVRDPDERRVDRSRPGRVVDVTHYPEINDLVLAADVAVLDYSSLRFDWALTGKPVVFFVPDLESYFDARPPVLEFASTAPGPWARTLKELVEHLRRPDLSCAHADERRQFNERFNRLNDGYATERVLDTFLDETMPWRHP
jgi:glycosyltransferase involved in cell wall biosynthesis/CDP-glycerol glycerophosphotransferase (TagB/SpsB family)